MVIAHYSTKNIFVRAQQIFHVIFKIFWILVTFFRRMQPRDHGLLQLVLKSAVKQILVRCGQANNLRPSLGVPTILKILPFKIRLLYHRFSPIL